MKTRWPLLLCSVEIKTKESRSILVVAMDTARKTVEGNSLTHTASVSSSSSQRHVTSVTNTEQRQARTRRATPTPTPTPTPSTRISYFPAALTCSNSRRLCICSGGPLSVSSHEKSAHRRNTKVENSQSHK